MSRAEMLIDFRRELRGPEMMLATGKDCMRVAAVVKMSLDFHKLSSAKKLQAILEEWDLQRIHLELRSSKSGTCNASTWNSTRKGLPMKKPDQHKLEAARRIAARCAAATTTPPAWVRAILKNHKPN